MKKKVKIKVKKRKINFKRIFILLFIITILVLSFLFIKDLPIKNIYIIGNNLVSDKEVIEGANIENYPSFICTSKKDIIKKIVKNDLIKEVKVKKKFWGKIYIYITENKIISIYNNKLLLETGKEIDNNNDILYAPIISNDISAIKDKYIEMFSKVNDDILIKISEIEYVPNEVDKERFLLKMNDGNIVYITLSKVIKINKYNDIYNRLEGKKGIIYLDAGDYFEIKE